MEFQLFFKGLLTGLLVSLPIGPLAILVIQRTANKNLKSGYFTGLGVATTDTLWALIAGFSVTYIITFLREHQMLIQGIGALVLFLLGYYIFQSHPARSIRKFKRKGTNPIQCFASSVLVAFSNPLVVLAYIAIFASTSVVFDLANPITPLLFLLGFFTGAMSWWTILTISINHFRHHFNLRMLWWFNKISGVMVMLFVVISAVVVLIKGSPSI